MQGHFQFYIEKFHFCGMIILVKSVENVMDKTIYISGIKLKDEIPEDNYLHYLPVIRNLREQGGLTFEKPITFLVGENGIGKSTLIEAIAISAGFNPEGGTRNYNFHTKNTHSGLSEYITLIKSYKFAKNGYFLRAESFYNTISYRDYVVEAAYSNRDFFQFLDKDSIKYSSWHSMSHGESFLKAVSEFLPNGLYILDEPEAALSPSGIMKLMSYMNELVENGCQFIISTHSPLLMAMPNADVYQLTQEDIKKVPYRETEHYILTRQFLENPEKIFRYLFSKDD